MSNGVSGWRAGALGVYRLGRLELDNWKGTQAADVAYSLEDLREALLDLKEATIAGDEPRALRHMEEVKLIVMELRLLGGGDPNE